ncbi:cob(I)yrinic acid a,c-diamide adenosyltransferase [Candidatus Gottesmanbacteria bacterium]|nr:cob(I)yrinic acid a,c-diamide adenosyltransferase [Candidatus Gottesmanbacteria bacterium]
MRGLMIVFTGNGKGKTEAAFGLALRSLGWGKKVLIIQFLKKWETGELKAIKQLSNLAIEQFGTKGFVDPKKLRPIDFKEVHRAMDRALYAIRYLPYAVVILDEINVAVKFGLISKEEVIRLLKLKPPEMTIVLTGRAACPEFIEGADLVTEFVEIKHPYKMGEKAKKGIDY